MEDKLKNLQSQMAEQLIQTQKLVGQSSQMVMMMQNIQELLKKSFNVSHNSALNSNSENPQEDDYGGTNPECLQIAPNSLPNSNSNPSSENHPPQSFGYVQKLDFSIFDGTNSENHLHKSLEKLSFFDVEVTECPKLVSQLYFEDDKQEPTLFAAFPICFNDGTVVHSPEKNIYEHGKTYDRPQELYEPVKAWKFVESVKPANSVLTVMDNWSGPDKPWVSYEGCRRTLLIALNFVHILKWKLGLHGKFVWYKLLKILDVLEEKPPPSDLVVHKHLLEDAVEHDEGYGPGAVEIVEWLWEEFWRFNGIFEGFEYLPKSFKVMASMSFEFGDEDARNLETLVGFLCSGGKTIEARKPRINIFTTGWKPSRVILSKVANVSCEKRDFEDVLTIFSEMKYAPGFVVVSRAVHLLCSHFGIGRADLFLWELKKIGFISNEIILGVFISFCCRDAFWFLSDIFMGGLKPSSCSYNALIRMMFKHSYSVHHMVESFDLRASQF